ncbi:MAG: hypothetical protein K6A23_16025 [Butyrivibrio sp.]|nr:hypothetical protein [Butyrivibrio sp.]
MKKVLLIINASAGKGFVKAKIFDMVSKLTNKGCLVTVYTIDPGHGAESDVVISEYGSEMDVIACSGGDGTLNRVISSLVKNELYTPISYLPSGSANDFGKSINNGKAITLDSFCKATAGDKTYKYDIGTVNGRCFNYVAAFGAFINVSYNTPQYMKNALGYGAYVLGVIASIPDAIGYCVHMTIEHDDGIEEGNYILGAISNSTSVGGIKTPILKNANLNDGLFELLLISAPTSVVELNETITVLAAGSVDNKYVKVISSSHFLIKAEKEVAWTVDGEEMESCLSADIRVLNKRMEIML